MKPEIFGKYVLLERLGAGGMGEVMLAKAGAKGFERYFAIKRILTQGQDNDEMTRGLVSEAKLSISLAHPNIAGVIEFGRVGEHFFLAMEYVEGVSLSTILSEVARGEVLLTPQDAIFCIIQICRALHYAHDKCDVAGTPLGVVHRDISPQNILVDINGLAKLIDFGVAKASTNLDKSGAGIIKGKLGYMAPEQASAGAIDRRSDIYALGIVLWECLTHRRMFEGNDVLGLLRKVAAGATVDPAEIMDGKAPQALLDALRTALALRPEERYASAGAMERDLSLALAEIAPGYTAYGLAELVGCVDKDRADRHERFKRYSQVTVAEALAQVRANLDAIGHEGLNVSDTYALRTPTGSHQAAPPASRTPWLAIVFGALLAAGTVVGGIFALRSSAPPAEPAAAAAPVRTLLVETLPEGASVYVAGELRGLSPLTVSGVDAEATVQVRVEKPGFEPQTRGVAPGGERTVAVRFELVKVGGDAEADKATAAGKPGETARSKRATRRAPQVEKGCVSVLVDPWADVSINGRKVGTTPVKCHKLAPGKYKLKITNPALGVDKTIPVTIKSAETTRIVEHL